MANGDDHPFLTARHVDDLTSAVKTLTRTIVQLGETAQKQLAATRELNGLLRAAQAPEPADSRKATPAEGVSARSSTAHPARRKAPR